MLMDNINEAHTQTDAKRHTQMVSHFLNTSFSGSLCPKTCNTGVEIRSPQKNSIAILFSRKKQVKNLIAFCLNLHCLNKTIKKIQRNIKAYF